MVVRVALNIFALAEGVPERSKERSGLAVVEVANDGQDGLGGFLSLVEGNATVRMGQLWSLTLAMYKKNDLREKVVNNVESNDAAIKFVSCFHSMVLVSSGSVGPR